MGPWVGSELLPGASPLGVSVGCQPHCFAHGHRATAMNNGEAAPKLCFFFFSPLYFMYLTPPAMPSLVAMPGWRKSSLCPLHLSVSLCAKDSAGTRHLYTSTDPLGRGEGSLGYSWLSVAFLQQPKGPCDLSQLPGACSLSEGRTGLPAERGSGLCQALSSAGDSRGGVYAGGMARHNPSPPHWLCLGVPRPPSSG